MQTSRLEVAWNARKRFFRVLEVNTRASHKFAAVAATCDSRTYNYHLNRIRRVQTLACRFASYLTEQLSKEA